MTEVLHGSIFDRFESGLFFKMIKLEDFAGLTSNLLFYIPWFDFFFLEP